MTCKKTNDKVNDSPWYYLAANDCFSVKYKSSVGKWLIRSVSKDYVVQIFDEYPIEDDHCCWMIGRNLLEDDSLESHESSSPEQLLN